MHDLPPRLRWYLAALYLASLLLVVWQGVALSRHPTVVALWWPVAVFAALILATERVRLQVNGAIAQSLSTTACIAAVVLFPAPLPVLITLPALVLTQVIRPPLPLHKRLFNVAAPTLAIGVSSALVSRLDPPPDLLRPDHIPAAFPVLALLLTVYYALDTLPIVGVMALLDGQAPWRVWVERHRQPFLPQLAAGTVGVLAAVVWLYHPLLIVLFVVPILGLRVAFRAIGQAEIRAKALQRRSAQLEAVLSCGQQLRLEHTPADLLERVTIAAREMVEAAAVVAYAPDPDAPRTLERLVIHPCDGRDAPGPAMPAHLPLPAPEAGIAEEMCGDTRVVTIPLMQEDRSVVSLLRLVAVPVALSPDDRDALAVLATQAGMALANAQLHARALAQASEDSLTGLLNHRAFQDRIEQEVARTRRGGQNLALIMIDLDGFGTVNNAHGHQAGDVTLLAVARCLRDQTRQADVAARYGGDEFALILPETGLDEALDTAERVRSELARLTVAHGSQAIHVTTSIGVAVMPGHATTREDLIGAADRASYAAKRAGKDRVRQAEAGALPHDPVALAARLDDANLATVETIAATVDAKDAYTRGHSGRVATYAAAIADALGLPEADVARIRQAGLLHDVGKIGVPDAVLLKPGQLTDEEFAVIKQHPEIGERILRGLPFLAEILPAVRHHHERWDGRGYPDGLAGDAIPPDAAIMAVADSLDAMTSSRTYRVALPIAEAIRRVREGAGAQYDPRVVVAFDRALADGTLMLPPLRPRELWALPPRGDGAPARSESVRAGVLRVVG